MKLLEYAAAFASVTFMILACIDVLKRGDFFALDYYILGMTCLFTTVTLKQVNDSRARDRINKEG